MDASFRSVHSAAFRSVSVIEQFRRQESQYGALFSLEYEFRYRGAVLAEVNHQLFSRVQLDYVTVGVLALDDNLAVLPYGVAAYLFPDIHLLWREFDVFEQIDFGSFRRHYLTSKFPVYFGGAEFFGCKISRKNTCVILLTVKYRGVGYRTRNAGFPILAVGAEILLAAVRIAELKHAAECGFLSYHTLVVRRRDDLVSPPARGGLHGKAV